MPPEENPMQGTRNMKRNNSFMHAKFAYPKLENRLIVYGSELFTTDMHFFFFFFFFKSVKHIWQCQGIRTMLLCNAKSLCLLTPFAAQYQGFSPNRFSDCICHSSPFTFQIFSQCATNPTLSCSLQFPLVRQIATVSPYKKENQHQSFYIQLNKIWLVLAEYVQVFVMSRAFDWTEGYIHEVFFQLDIVLLGELRCADLRLLSIFQDGFNLHLSVWKLQRLFRGRFGSGTKRRKSWQLASDAALGAHKATTLSTLVGLLTVWTGWSVVGPRCAVVVSRSWPAYPRIYDCTSRTCLVFVGGAAYAPSCRELQVWICAWEVTTNPGPKSLSVTHFGNIEM